MANTYWNFINRATQQYASQPGSTPLKVMGLSYGQYKELPCFPLEANVVVFSNYGPAEWNVDGPAITREMQQWSLRTRNWGNHTWAHGSGYLIPRIFTNGFQQMMQTAIRAGLGAKYAHIETYPNWGLTGPQFYLMSKIVWNPWVDTNAVRQQFANDMFGPAANDMKTYFETLEALWQQLDTVDSFPAADGGVKITERKARMWLDSGDFVSQFATTPASQALYTAARNALNAALSRTLTGDELARVRFFSDTFALTEGLVRLYNLKKANAPTATRQQALDETAALWNNNLRLNFATLYETGASSAGGMAFTGACTATTSSNVVTALCQLKP